MKIILTEQSVNNILQNILEQNNKELTLLGYHSSKRSLKDGFYKGSTLDPESYEDVIRNAYMEIVSDFDEILENDDIEGMNNTFEELGYGFTYVSKNPIDSTSYQYSKYKYGDYLYEVYGSGNEILLDDINEIDAEIVVSKLPLYFKLINIE